jgi:hypothetical protein
VLVLRTRKTFSVAGFQIFDLGAPGIGGHLTSGIWTGSVNPTVGHRPP